MKKEILSDSVVVYLGDCLEILPELEVFDAIVTDPPYNLQKYNTRGFNKNWAYPAEELLSWDNAITKEHVELIFEKSKNQILWGGNYYLDFLPRTKQMLIWNKMMRGLHFNDCEIAWCSQFKEASRIYDFHVSKNTDKKHPTAKPIELMRWCLSQLPPETVSICDPFLGSGTTGVAAINMGMSFVGIEKEEKYFDVSVKRLLSAIDQPDFFVRSKKEKKEKPPFLI